LTWGQEIPVDEKARESGDRTPNTQTASAYEKEKNGPFSFFKVFSGNPGRAALYSAILPGAGQAYNKKYWKVPIVLAAEGTAIGFIVYNQQKYRNWRLAHRLMSEGELPGGYLGATTPSQARLVRDQWAQRRDYAIIGTVAIHIIQIADAFIHRHLIEFDVSDDLSFNAFTNGQSLMVTVSF